MYRNDEIYLVVGLGNPGKSYEDTRHNAGYKAVKRLAEKAGLVFKPDLEIAKGQVARGVIGGKRVLLLLPLTYMNESGLSVRLCADYFKIPHDHLIVVVDDVALPFGKLRLRTTGSSGGHNGLKSIEAHLESQNYTRLRIGVGEDLESELADYVLAKFTEEEKGALNEIMDKAVTIIEIWLALGPDVAMKSAN